MMMITHKMPLPPYGLILAYKHSTGRGGGWGVVRERVRTAGECRYVSNIWLLSDWTRTSSLHPTGHRTTDNPSMLPLWPSENRPATDHL